MSENQDLHREQFEQQVRQSWEKRDFDEATRLCIKGLGPEIIGFLDARLRSLSDAEEVFCIFSEDLWRGLPTFQWRSKVRVWAYKIAINAANRYMSAPQRKRNRNLNLSRVEFLQRAVDRVRTTTVAYLKTRNKTRMQELLETLPQQDHALLILRIDRGFSWRDLATTLSSKDEPKSEEEIERIAAKLRKRFERIKLRLRELAEQGGIVEGNRDGV